MKHLDRIVGPGVPLFSLVVFSERAAVIRVDHDPEKNSVLRADELAQYFKQVSVSMPDALTAEETQALYQRLLPYTQVDEAEKKAHIQRVETRQERPQRCPWCGGELVLRTAKRGAHAGQQFYGCGNYPRCRYTRDVDASQ